MSDLRTINPGVRRIGGIYTIKNDGEDMPKQPPAIINPGAVKRVTRARGEEQQIPQVEIYYEEAEGKRVPREEMKGLLAGQTAKPAKEISYAQREARKQLASKKALIEAEREIIEEKVAKKIEREIAGKKQKIEKGVVTEIVPYVKKAKKVEEKPDEKEIAELKLKKAEEKKQVAELKLKKAETKQKTEEAKTKRAETYLEFANARAKQLQEQKGIKWKEAKAEATDEWKKRAVRTPGSIPGSEYYVTEPESSATSESTHRKRFEIMAERQKKLADTEGSDSYEISPSGHVKRIERKAITDKSGSESSKKSEAKAGAGEEPKPKPKMATVKRADGTITRVPMKEKSVDVEKEQKKAEDIKLKPSQPALRQRDILGYVEALSDEELKMEYRSIHPRKPFPSKLKMRNAVTKSYGGRVRGGKTVFSSTEED